MFRKVASFIKPLSIVSLPLFVGLALQAQRYPGAIGGVDGDAPRGYVGHITAHIALEDGSALPSAPFVYLFPAEAGRCELQDVFRTGTLQFLFTGNGTMSQGEVHNGCYIRLSLAGYHTFTGWVEDNQTIVMKRLGPHEGSSVSVVSLNAPADARKEYQAGEKAIVKKKLADAEAHFESAVALYPSYSLAWSELGRALQLQGHTDQAVGALKHARETDPKYIKPIVQLTGIAIDQQQWQQALEYAEEALPLNPVEFPVLYYYRAEAAYELKRPEAEQLTRQAIQLDTAGESPDSLFLLGQIFADKGDSADALVEYKSYLQAAPHGDNAQKAKSEIARLKNQ